MAKKSTVKVRLVPEEKTDSKFYYYAKKPTSGLKAKDKLRMKKYNPATKKHEWFVEKKLPPHSKQLFFKIFFSKLIKFLIIDTQISLINFGFAPSFFA